MATIPPVSYLELNGPHSYVEYIGDGSTTQFSVPFPYLDDAHIAVLVDDYEVEFSFLSAGTVSVTPAPAVDASVVVQRRTPATLPSVSHAEGSLLRGSQLNLSTKQLLYAIQENADAKEPARAALLRADLAAADGAALVSYLQSGTGAVARTALAKMRDFISVKDFGAVGDGMVDDKPAIQAAVDACFAAGGGTVWLPPGVYGLASAGVQLKSNVRLCGSGRGATFLRRIADVTIGMTSLTSTINAGISDLTIDGRWDASGTDGMYTETGQHGISCQGSTGTQFATIERVTISNIRTYGIGMQDVGPYVGNQLRDVRIENCGSDGVDLKNDGFGNRDNVFDGIYIDGIGRYPGNTGKAGIDIRGPALLSNIAVRNIGASVGVRFRFTGLDGSNGTGGEESALTNFRIYGSPDSEGRTAGSIGVNVGATERVSVTNGVIKDCAIGVQHSFSVDETNRHSVTSVHVHDCTTGFQTMAGANSIAFTASDAQTCTTGWSIDSEKNVLTGCGVFDCTNGVAFGSSSRDSYITGLRYKDVTTLFNYNGLRHQVIGCTPAYIPTVASAGTLVPPFGASVLIITGTTNIGQINGGWPGRELRLLFTGALTVTDATSNIRLNGNFTTNNGAALCLVFDGTNWQEMSRNPNTA